VHVCRLLSDFTIYRTYLYNKYPGIYVPPIPKQELYNHQTKYMELFLNFLQNHKILSLDPNLLMFISEHSIDYDKLEINNTL